MADSKPVRVLCIYSVSPGKEDAFRPLLENHWPTLDRLGPSHRTGGVVPRERQGGEALLRICFAHLMSFEGLDSVQVQSFLSVRRHILVVRFRGGAMTAGEIASRFQCTWPTVSRHLRVLEHAGLPAGKTGPHPRLLDTDRLEVIHEWLEWLEHGEKRNATDETPQRRMTGRSAVRARFPGTHEDHPWGEHVAKVGKKVFVFFGRRGASRSPSSLESSGASVYGAHQLRKERLGHRELRAGSARRSTCSASGSKRVIEP